jgi:PKD repeat protein
VESDTYKAFWNLSHKATMYGDASDLCAFRLMPLVPALQKPIAADWSFKVIDHERRSIGFTDRSTGKITSWRWDFGDGKNSTERHPVHTYAQGGEYIVILDIEGPDGKARRAKVWDVVFK